MLRNCRFALDVSNISLNVIIWLFSYSINLKIRLHRIRLLHNYLIVTFNRSTFQQNSLMISLPELIQFFTWRFIIFLHNSLLSIQASFMRQISDDSLKCTLNVHACLPTANISCTTQEWWLYTAVNLHGLARTIKAFKYRDSNSCKASSEDTSGSVDSSHWILITHSEEDADASSFNITDIDTDTFEYKPSDSTIQSFSNI